MLDAFVRACTNLEVEVHQVALVELVDPLQCLPDQTGDLGLGQQLVRGTVVKYLPACRTGRRQSHTQITPETETKGDLPAGAPRGAGEPALS